MCINSYFSSSSFENFLKILGFLEQSNPNTSTSVFTFFAKAYKVGFFPANPILSGLDLCNSLSMNYTICASYSKEPLS